jgi:two-component system sensor histidine kinase VanS
LNAIDEDRFGRTLLVRLLTRFFLAIVLYTVALAVLLFVVLYIGLERNLLRDTSRIINVLLNYNYTLLVIPPMLWGVGFLIIMLVFWRRTIGYIGAIAGGIDRLLDPNTNVASLPSDLQEVEGRLNQVKYDLLRNQQLAKEAEQRKNDLVVYLAHDLKTPLTSVIGYLSLLRDERQISEELRGKYLSIAATKAEKLEDLINEFFEITRFSLKNLTLDTARINLTRMLEQMADEFKPLLAPKGLSCSVKVDQDIMISGDASKLERVFDNLVRNAITYSYENSEIEISAVRHEQGVTIRVRNQGDTIPEHKLNHIFEQFYRLDASRNAASGGAGLGLAIAKEIVELHQGTITASSIDGMIEFSTFLPA